MGTNPNLFDNFHPLLDAGGGLYFHLLPCLLRYETPEGFFRRREALLKFSLPLSENIQSTKCDRRADEPPWPGAMPARFARWPLRRRGAQSPAGHSLYLEIF